MSTRLDKRRMVVVGAGPVGSLAAIYAAKRGYQVDVYDLRSDLRHEDTTPLNFTKSINLALSERGINGIRSSQHENLLDKILSQTIPMHGRMIHTWTTVGNLSQQSQAYDVHGRFQRSVDRGELNKCLLNELDGLPNVTLHFQHKLTGANFKTRKAWFEDQTRGNTQPGVRQPEIEIDFDLMLGCDGAFSAVRYHLMKFALVNYQQEYIDCLWCEFCMPPTPSGDFQISPDHLHIWPAGDFMFIALPNLDKSFVCTLFGPVSLFTKLETSTTEDLSAFFDKHFPGVTDLIPRDDLQAQFKRNPHLPLINIKCSPHHYGSSVVILGDAAHAMVPFYGQGMNAGLESVRVLFEHLDRYTKNNTAAAGDDDESTARALSEYTATRVEDAHAIANLALGNYYEMRAAVTSPVYKARKFVEEQLHKHFPSSGWATQYSRVSFSNMPYSRIIERSARQKSILQAVFASVTSASILAVIAVTLRILRNRRLAGVGASSGGWFWF